MQEATAAGDSSATRSICGVMRFRWLYRSKKWLRNITRDDLYADS